MKLTVQVFILCILSMLTACSMTGAATAKVEINGTDLKGVVIEAGSGKPIEGVRIVAATEFGNATGAKKVRQGETHTDPEGRFEIPKNPIEIISYQNYIMNSASLSFEKEGYCLLSRIGGLPDGEEAYTIELKRPDGNCIVYTSEN